MPSWLDNLLHRNSAPAIVPKKPFGLASLELLGKRIPGGLTKQSVLIIRETVKSCETPDSVGEDLESKRAELAAAISNADANAERYRAAAEQAEAEATESRASLQGYNQLAGLL